MNEPGLPIGKLPHNVLTTLLAQIPIEDPRVILGPGIGFDCAVIDLGSRYLVVKSDPITFTADDIGWYLVQVNANDLATTGAVPLWLLVTLLLPEGKTTAELALSINQQIVNSCRSIGVSVIGGHTEITQGLHRPIAIGTLIGEVKPAGLVTPKGATPGDVLLLTKGVAIEATSILAHEFSDRLAPVLGSEKLKQAQEFLLSPGISVLNDAQIATESGRVTAMHDPTEGGLLTALWEMAFASSRTFAIDLQRVPISAVTAMICEELEIDPLAAISSGALLLTTPPEDAPSIQSALESNGIQSAIIGRVEIGPPTVLNASDPNRIEISKPSRDEIARLFETRA